MYQAFIDFSHLTFDSVEQRAFSFGSYFYFPDSH